MYILYTLHLYLLLLVNIIITYMLNIYLNLFIFNCLDRNKQNTERNKIYSIKKVYKIKQIKGNYNIVNIKTVY